MRELKVQEVSHVLVLDRTREGGHSLIDFFATGFKRTRMTMYYVFGRVALLSAAFCLCWSLGQSSRQCHFPPSVWCSSRTIARACQVEEQCENNAWWIQNSAPKVNLTLYYETLCPDCKEFVELQLWPTFQKVANIFNLDLLPYGNAREKQIGDTWQFDCQHGPMECLGNLIQTCAIHLTGGNISKVFPFIACMETSDQAPSESGPVCAKKQGIDYEAVKSCTSSSLGNKLEHEMAVKTDQLDPPHTYVPWITLNGVHTEDIQQRAQSDLLKLICDTYTGPKPAACRETEILHKCHKDNL